jgi:outer membrane receptor protein involved in Fe transport
MRITFNVNNLLDQRVKVRDNAGLTPLSYQPGYVDPVGRTVRIGIRKLFF